MSSTTMGRLAMEGGTGEGLLSRLAAAWRRARMEAATRDELYRLSDRELKDIGLTRMDVPDAVRRSLTER